MKKTNLFIVGAAKAGTTTIYDYLCEHPDIYMSPIKEPHFFCSDIRRVNFTQPHYKDFDIDIGEYLKLKPLKKRHISYIDNIAHYNALFEGRLGERYAGESSGGYLCSATAAGEIYDYNPDAKIIISLREPVDRAYSHWKMNIANGRENDKISFSECIERAYTRPDKAWGVEHLYVDLSLYYIQIERYMRQFPKENIYIAFYKDLMVSPQNFMDGIYSFLNVESMEVNTEKKSNASLRSKFPRIKALIQRYQLTQYFDRSSVEKVKRLTSSSDFSVLTEQEKKVIYDRYFKGEILRLQDLLQKDLSVLMVS